MDLLSFCKNGYDKGMHPLFSLGVELLLLMLLFDALDLCLFVGGYWGRTHTGC